jgi:hypothetical protein
MRRLLLLTIGLLTLALAAPSVASAYGHHHGHHHKHRHHKAHRALLTGDAAGTIASFDGTTLTITLKDGSTVSGAVTDDTEIRVIEVTPAAAASHQGDDDQGDDDHWWDHHRSCGSDDGDTGDLVAGATVWKASLEFTPDGAEWEKVKLLVPQQSSDS